MCGFAGVLTSGGLREEELVQAARKMIEPLVHRGPDDQGIWVDAEAGVGLGFRRLAILDLSEHGHQPMRSASGRYTLVFNGEVYNHLELRRHLENTGHRFRGHSDTEVLLAAFEEWGVEAAVRRFVGMFAIALWDASRRLLSLARDPVGIKPLYVHSNRGTVTFGSELKALVAGPDFDRTLDEDAVAAYLRYLCVPAPRSIYRRAIKLLPGHLLHVADPAAPLPRPVPYWSAEEAAERGLADPLRGSDEEMVDELERRLLDSVGMHMHADVPLGALLSGGIDSTVVVALLQELSPRRVKTFSVAFEEAEHNEAHHAAAVAAHVGTDHTEVMLTGRDALDVVPRLPRLYDEPYANASQLPTVLVCGVARRDVVVALSGDGGDEVFGGYNRYTYGQRLLSRVDQVPRPARRMVAAGIGSVSPAGWDRAHSAVAPVLPPVLRQRLPGEKLYKIRRMMASRSVAEMYRSLLAAWEHPERLLRSGATGADGVLRPLERGRPGTLLDQMMLADQLCYLPDDQMTKTDRASMAASLELRVPLLDHRVVELSWRLPAPLKVRGGEGKWILRQVLYRRVPRDLLERPKMGLSVPLAAWLRGPLRPWAEELLAPAALQHDPLLRPAPVRAAWQELQGGRDELALPLWAVLQLQAWRQQWS